MFHNIKDDIGNEERKKLNGIKEKCVGKKYMTFCCPTNASDLS